MACGLKYGRINFMGASRDTLCMRFAAVVDSPYWRRSVINEQIRTKRFVLDRSKARNYLRPASTLTAWMKSVVNCSCPEFPLINHRFYTSVLNLIVSSISGEIMFNLNRLVPPSPKFLIKLIRESAGKHTVTLSSSELRTTCSCNGVSSMGSNHRGSMVFFGFRHSFNL